MEDKVFVLRDVFKYFFFEMCCASALVVPNSGYGTDKFEMVRNGDGTGSLKIIQALDFEDPLQSDGFRFRIKVNDKGGKDDIDEDGHINFYHTAFSWVVVKLRDINDNEPVFDRKRKSDPDRYFAINQDGVVTVARELDHEKQTKHVLKILAIDDGLPPKTSTATLTINVQDINDNAPTFMQEYRPVLPEHVPPRKILDILAVDKDERPKGNAGPFTFKLDPNADGVIRTGFRIEQVQKQNSKALKYKEEIERQDLANGETVFTNVVF
uniref:Cadherin domain-containing protein n=1 Tax=Megaselia scalaris TaxID=36166 RepID=T1GFD7_MEGSC